MGRPPESVSSDAVVYTWGGPEKVRTWSRATQHSRAWIWEQERPRGREHQLWGSQSCLPPASWLPSLADSLVPQSSRSFVLCFYKMLNISCQCILIYSVMLHFFGIYNMSVFLILKICNWFIHTMEYCAALKINELLIHVIMWLNLENIRLNERSQTCKAM